MNTDAPQDDTNRNTDQNLEDQDTVATSPDSSKISDEAKIESAAPVVNIADLQATISDLEDRLKRAFAEQQNQRQRMLKEKANADRYAAAKLATDLFEVLDNMDRALLAVPISLADDPHIANLVTGIRMVQQQMLQVFNTHNIRQISPMGKQLDYEQHETIAEVDDNPAEAGIVVEVAQVGYIMHDRLLRPAKVVISSGRFSTEQTGNGPVNAKI